MRSRGRDAASRESGYTPGGVRWRKIARDLWRNRARTALVVLSIAVGVFAVGTILTSSTVLSREMTESYRQINPASVALYVDGVDQDMVDAMAHMLGVAAAEGRTRYTLRLKVGPDEWRTLAVMALADYDDTQMNKVWPEAGAWPPPKHGLLIERSGLALANAAIGSPVEVESYDGARRTMAVAGTTHDVNQFPSSLSNQLYGYVTADTLAWLGLPDLYTEVYLLAEDGRNDVDHLNRLAEEAQERLEKAGHTVYGYWVPTPGKHPADEIIQPVIMLMGVLGVLALGLSGFLVINTITAILAQQRRQIGIMKAVGAQSGQILGMYLGMVLAFGLLALAVAVPLGSVMAARMTRFVAEFVNFDVGSYAVPGNVLAVEIAIGLIAPLVAAAAPVWSGTRLTAREAMSGYGLEAGRRGLLDRLLGRVRGLPRPVLLSLRNTFRRKARLALTLATLTLAGGIFVGILSVHAAMRSTLDDALGYWNHELTIQFRRAYRVEQIEGLMESLPGVAAVEAWEMAGAERARPDGSQGDSLYVVAPPAETEMVLPVLVDGRWLLPEDENAAVINTLVLRDEPDLKVGDDLVLRLDRNGEPVEQTYRIVGVVKGMMTAPIVYANYSYFSRAMGRQGRAFSARVQLLDKSAANQTAMGKTLEAELNRLGLRVNSWEATADLRAQVETQLNLIVVLLMAMAVLLALVGGLGLMGTMSINVLERTREVGVMRAIGATSGAVLQIVITEGVIIGVLSWVLGTLLALPLSRGLSAALGAAVIRSPLNDVFSWGAVALWLALVAVLAAVASYLPARHASRITVRDVLAYE